MNTINKVICLKASPLNQSTKTKMDTINSVHFKVYKELFNEFVCWGNDSVYSKDSIKKETDGTEIFVAIELEAKRKELYEYTDKSISYDSFKNMLKLLSIAFADSKQSRGMVSTMIGSSLETACVENSDFKIIDELVNKYNRDTVKNTKIITKIGNTLKKIGFRNRSPFNLPLSPGERYSVIGNVHRAYTSWVECDKERGSTYEAEIVEIDEAFKKITPSIAKDLKEFLEKCISQKWISHFDPRVHAYLRDCVVPALNSGKEITNHFYIHKETKIDFSLHTDFIQELKSRPALWKDESPAILETIHILEMMMTHEKHHPHAFYPFVSDTNTNRSQYLLGDNYTSYEMYGIGQDVPNVTITIDDKPVEFIKGKEVKYLNVKFNRSKEDTEELSFNIHTKDKYHSGSFNPNNYFKNLKVWQIATDKCTYLFEFTHKGQTVRATVKEPSFVTENGTYFIRLNMSVILDSDVSQNEALKWYLSSALPSSANDRSVIKETPANNDRFKIIKGNTYRVMGVDLGQSTPFSWAVGETTITGPVNALDIIATGEYDNGSNDDYFDLINDIKSLSKIIGMTKGVKNGSQASKSNIFIDKTVARAKAYLGNHTDHIQNKNKVSAILDFVNSDISVVDSINEIMKKHNNDLIKVKTDFTFVGNMVLRYIKRRYGELINQRKFHLRTNSVDTKLQQEFKWLSILDGMKRLSRAFNYLGTDNTRTPITLDSMVDYNTGCKDNFLKQIASAIVKVAVDNKCNVIVLEDLGNKNKSLNKRDENFLQSLWSPQRIKGAIENAANWHGIAVAEVSESQTSQVHYESGTFGHRDKKNLFYKNEKGEIKSVNADINAAKNIAFKFVTRHASSRQVAVKYLSDSQDEGKRIKGFLTHKFGSIEKTKAFFNTNLPNVDYVYLDGDTWISLEQKNTKQKNIKDELNSLNKKTASGSVV